MPLRQHTWPRHHTSWIPRASGQARHHPTIDGDHVAKAAIHGAWGPFEDGAGQFIGDFEGSVPPDQPVEESMEAILSVPQRHDGTFAGACVR
jgi:hypothetical protein